MAASFGRRSSSRHNFEFPPSGDQQSIQQQQPLTQPRTQQQQWNPFTRSQDKYAMQANDRQPPLPLPHQQSQQSSQQQQRPMSASTQAALERRRLAQEAYRQQLQQQMSEREAAKARERAADRQYVGGGVLPLGGGAAAAGGGGASSQYSFQQQQPAIVSVGGAGAVAPSLRSIDSARRAAQNMLDSPTSVNNKRIDPQSVLQQQRESAAQIAAEQRARDERARLAASHAAVARKLAYQQELRQQMADNDAARLRDKQHRMGRLTLQDAAQIKDEYRPTYQSPVVPRDVQPRDAPMQSQNESPRVAAPMSHRDNNNAQQQQYAAASSSRNDARADYDAMSQQHQMQQQQYQQQQQQQQQQYYEPPQSSIRLHAAPLPRVHITPMQHQPLISPYEPQHAHLNSMQQQDDSSRINNNNNARDLEYEYQMKLRERLAEIDARTASIEMQQQRVAQQQKQQQQLQLQQQQMQQLNQPQRQLQSQNDLWSDFDSHSGGGGGSRSQQDYGAAIAYSPQNAQQNYSSPPQQQQQQQFNSPRNQASQQQQYTTSSQQQYGNRSNNNSNNAQHARSQHPSSSGGGIGGNAGLHDWKGGMNAEEQSAKAQRALEYRLELERQMAEKEQQKHAAKAEQQRREAKEAAEALNYNPFGKAGSGAPMRDAQGGIVATRKQTISQKDTKDVQAPEMSTAAQYAAAHSPQHAQQQQQQYNAPAASAYQQPLSPSRAQPMSVMAAALSGGQASSPQNASNNGGPGGDAVASFGRFKFSDRSAESQAEAHRVAAAQNSYQQDLANQVRLKQEAKAKAQQQARDEEAKEQQKFDKQQASMQQQIEDEKQTKRKAQSEVDTATSAKVEQTSSAANEHKRKNKSQHQLIDMPTVEEMRSKQQQQQQQSHSRRQSNANASSLHVKSAADAASSLFGQPPQQSQQQLSSSSKSRHNDEVDDPNESRDDDPMSARRQDADRRFAARKSSLGMDDGPTTHRQRSNHGLSSSKRQIDPESSDELDAMSADVQRMKQDLAREQQRLRHKLNRSNPNHNDDSDASYSRAEFALQDGGGGLSSYSRGHSAQQQRHPLPGALSHADLLDDLQQLNVEMANKQRQQQQHQQQQSHYPGSNHAQRSQFGGPGAQHQQHQQYGNMNRLLSQQPLTNRSHYEQQQQPTQRLQTHLQLSSSPQFDPTEQSLQLSSHSKLIYDDEAQLESANDDSGATVFHSRLHTPAILQHTGTNQPQQQQLQSYSRVATTQQQRPASRPGLMATPVIHNLLSQPKPQMQQTTPRIEILPQPATQPRASPAQQRRTSQAALKSSTPAASPLDELPSSSQQQEISQQHAHSPPFTAAHSVLSAVADSHPNHSAATTARHVHREHDESKHASQPIDSDESYEADFEVASPVNAPTQQQSKEKVVSPLILVPQLHSTATNALAPESGFDSTHNSHRVDSNASTASHPAPTHHLQLSSPPKQQQQSQPQPSSTGHVHQQTIVSSQPATHSHHATKPLLELARQQSASQLSDLTGSVSHAHAEESVLSQSAQGGDLDSFYGSGSVHHARSHSPSESRVKRDNVIDSFLSRQPLTNQSTHASSAAFTSTSDDHLESIDESTLNPL